MRVSSIQELECCLCLDATPTQILRPCNHQCLCEPCFRVIANTKPFCPLCRAPIQSVGLEGVAEPIAEDVWATFQAKRADYFAKANPIISWNGSELSFEFDSVSGFYPTKHIMDDLFNELGFKRGNSTKLEMYGIKMQFTKNGEVIQRGPGAKFEAKLYGDVKFSSSEMSLWIKNCAFHHFSHQTK